MEIYICRKGDEISRIARETGVDEEKLRGINGLYGGEKLCEGLSLWLPGKGSGGKLELMACADINTDIPLSFAVSLPVPLIGAGGIQPTFFPPVGDSPRLLWLCSSDETGFPAPKAMHAMLSEPEKLSDAITEAAQTYDGVFLSLSYIFGFDREPLSRFLALLSEKLHKAGLYFVCALAPKEGDSDHSPACAALDYHLCAGLCDRIVLLCYDYAHSRSAPGASAPLDAVSRCVDYALHHAPCKKLLLALSQNGYRWQLPWRQGSFAEPVSNQRAQALALSSGTKICYDRSARSPFFCHEDILHRRFIYFFEDARSISEKLSIVSSRSLAGIFVPSLRHGTEYLRCFEPELFI